VKEDIILIALNATVARPQLNQRHNNFVSAAIKNKKGATINVRSIHFTNNAITHSSAGFA
jgi:hypothetical protein